MDQQQVWKLSIVVLVIVMMASSILMDLNRLDSLEAVHERRVVQVSSRLHELIGESENTTEVPAQIVPIIKRFANELVQLIEIKPVPVAEICKSLIETKEQVCLANPDCQEAFDERLKNQCSVRNTASGEGSPRALGLAGLVERLVSKKA